MIAGPPPVREPAFDARDAALNVRDEAGKVYAKLSPQMMGRR
jgi:hypothetical protein